jgi:hypothetical protein
MAAISHTWNMGTESPSPRFRHNDLYNAGQKTGHALQTDGTVWTNSQREQPVAWYRMYFLALSGEIRNVDEFEADGDESAVTFADNIHEAVSDLYVGYEVWSLSRRVAERRSRDNPRPSLCQAQVTRQMQALLLRRYEALQNSETAFSHSRQLLARTRELRNAVTAKPLPRVDETAKKATR